jgi:hypothetical protein
MPDISLLFKRHDRRGQSALRPSPPLPPQPFATKNCLLTQFSNRPSRRKRAAVRAAKARLPRRLSGA